MGSGGPLGSDRDWQMTDRRQFCRIARRAVGSGKQYARFSNRCGKTGGFGIIPEDADNRTKGTGNALAAGTRNDPDQLIGALQRSLDARSDLMEALSKAANERDQTTADGAPQRWFYIAPCSFTP